MTKKEKQAKVALVLREFKAGKLKSSSGEKITNPKQAWRPIDQGNSCRSIQTALCAGGQNL